MDRRSVRARRALRHAHDPVPPLIALPPHVWALVLHRASVHDIFIVAHVCRALHTLIFAQSRCTCGTSDVNENAESAHTRAFWAHLLDAGPPPVSFSEWQDFAYNGLVTHVILALRCGIDPAICHQWALRNASAKGHVAVVECLLRDERVDPRANDQCALLVASDYGHLEVVRCLLRDVRVVRDVHALRRAIGAAAYEGHGAIVDLLQRHCVPRSLGIFGQDLP